MNTVEKLKKWAPSALGLPKLVEMLRIFIAHSQNPVFEPIRDVVTVDSIDGSRETIKVSIECATRSKELFDSLGLSPNDFPIQSEIVMVGEQAFSSVCEAIYGTVLFWLEVGPVALETFEKSGFEMPNLSALIGGFYEFPNNSPQYNLVDGKPVAIRPWMQQPLRIDSRISLAGILAELSFLSATPTANSENSLVPYSACLSHKNKDVQMAAACLNMLHKKQPKSRKKAETLVNASSGWSRKLTISEAKAMLKAMAKFEERHRQ